MNFTTVLFPQFFSNCIKIWATISPCIILWPMSISSYNLHRQIIYAHIKWASWRPAQGPNWRNVISGHFLNLLNLKVFSMQSPNLNTILYEVSLIKIFIIQAAVVIIRKMYLVQNEKKSLKILGLSRHGLFCQKQYWAGCIFLIF